MNGPKMGRCLIRSGCPISCRKFRILGRILREAKPNRLGSSLKGIRAIKNSDSGKDATSGCAPIKDWRSVVPDRGHPTMKKRPAILLIVIPVILSYEYIKVRYQHTVLHYLRDETTPLSNLRSKNFRVCNHHKLRARTKVVNKKVADIPRPDTCEMIGSTIMNPKIGR
jgi:hypothetical protein